MVIETISNRPWGKVFFFLCHIVQQQQKLWLDLLDIVTWDRDKVQGLVGKDFWGPQFQFCARLLADDINPCYILYTILWLCYKFNLITLSHHGLKLVIFFFLPFKDQGIIQIVLIGKSLRQYSIREQIRCTYFRLIVLLLHLAKIRLLVGSLEWYFIFVWGISVMVTTQMSLWQFSYPYWLCGQIHFGCTKLQPFWGPPGGR